MQFSVNETITEDGGYKVFEIPEKIKNPKSFTVYEDDVISDDAYASVKRELSYSHDGSNWSNYQPLTSALLKDEKVLGKDIYFRIKFIRNTSSSPVKILTVNLTYEETPDEECEPKLVTTYMGLEFCTDSEFDPYKISAQAAGLESALNAHINKNIGMEVQYFHVKPDENSTDSILNEYSTFKESGKGGQCIKIMVPENSLPDPSLLHNEWGLDFEKFEVHVQSQYFETKFGKGEGPRQEDIVYFPKFNRLFYVSSVKPHLGTDGINQYWVMNLKKYDKNTAVAMSEESTEILNTLMKDASHEENFEVVNQEEGLDITNPIQNQIKTIALDDLRSFVNPNVVITDETIINNGSPIAQHAYNMATGNPGEIAVIYKPKVVIQDDLALTFWLNRVNPVNITDDLQLYYRNVMNYIPFSLTSAMRLDLKRVQVVADKPVAQTGVYQGCFIQQGTTIFLVSQVIDDYTYVLNTPDVVPLNTYRVATCEMLPSTYSQLQGFMAAFVSGRYIYIILGQAHFKFDTGLSSVTDTWMAFVINISATYSFVEVYVYSIEDRFPAYPAKYSTVLKQLTKQSKSITSAITGYANLQDHPLYLSFSNSKITNIRLWSQPIEEELHNVVLNQPAVHAVSKTFIIDNADPIYRFDKLGKGMVKYDNDTPEINAAE